VVGSTGAQYHSKDRWLFHDPEAVVEGQASPPPVVPLCLLYSWKECVGLSLKLRPASSSLKVQSAGNAAGFKAKDCVNSLGVVRRTPTNWGALCTLGAKASTPVVSSPPASIQCDGHPQDRWRTWHMLLFIADSPTLSLNITCWRRPRSFGGSCAGHID